jgi:sugar phosphate isomerase/epimerase
MNQFAVSSWALHRSLGVAYWNSPAQDMFEPKVHALPLFDVMELPSQLREHGFDRLELCHFHLANKEADYLSKFKSALKASGVTLQTLLIDNGDISDPEAADRDREWIEGWLRVAEALGAEGARVIAGKQPWSEEAIARSAKNLAWLANQGVRVRIENWFDLLQTPAQVHDLLDRLEGRVGLCVDLGNWTQPQKYERLAGISGRAETCHAKCEFIDPETIDAEDYLQSLGACKANGFSGPYVIVYCGVGETDWPAIELQREFIEKALA